MLTHGRKYLVILIALILSFLLHLTVAIPALFDGDQVQDLWDILHAKMIHLLHPNTPDIVLARKKAKSIPRVSLNLEEQSKTAQKPPQTITIRLIQDQPATTPKSPAKQVLKAKENLNKSKSGLHSNKSPHKSAKNTEDDLYDKLIDAPTTPVPSADTVEEPEDATPAYDLNNTLIDNSTTSIQPSTQQSASQPFPNALEANYRTTISGIAFYIHSDWQAKDHRYSITDKTVTPVLGFNVAVNSEGSITEQGLQPEKFQVALNGTPFRFADFDRHNMIMRFGNAENPKQMPFDTSIQDVASLPFQMALAFDQHKPDVQLTMGTGIYRIHFQLLDEEQLKLPIGVVRTLHIRGTGLDGIDATADVWLAPDYRNMPARVSISFGGYQIELRLSTLSIAGRQIFGKLHPNFGNADTPVDQSDFNSNDPISDKTPTVNSQK